MALFNFTFCNGRQVEVFREVLPYESISVLVQSTLPGGNKDARNRCGSSRSLGHAFVVRKFSAIVISDGMHPVDVRGKATSTTAPRTALAVLWRDSPDNRIQRLTLDQCDQRAPVSLADHGITLPVTKAPFGIHNGRALVNRDLVRDRCHAGL